MPEASWKDGLVDEVTFEISCLDTNLEGDSKDRVVLMSHGAPGSHNDFKYIVPLIHDMDIRTLAPNYPGAIGAVSIRMCEMEVHFRVWYHRSAFRISPFDRRTSGSSCGYDQRAWLGKVRPFRRPAGHFGFTLDSAFRISVLVGHSAGCFPILKLVAESRSVCSALLLVNPGGARPYR